MSCPCGSQQEFSSCCELIHQNQSTAKTAEQLMRARYSAFVVQNIDFLYNTFHPTSRRFQNKQEIKTWALENKWMQLEIVHTTNQTVTFKAHYLDPHLETQIHHEKSTFKIWNGLWYYVDGKLLD